MRERVSQKRNTSGQTSHTSRIRSNRNHSNNSSRRRSSSSKSNNDKVRSFSNTLLRQILICAFIIAALFCVKNTSNPILQRLNSSIEYGIKYNMEYDWIVSNISKTTAYILSTLSNSKF